MVLKGDYTDRLRRFFLVAQRESVCSTKGSSIIPASLMAWVCKAVINIDIYIKHCWWNDLTGHV